MAEKKKSKLKAIIERLTVFVTKDIWSFELYQKGPLRRAVANTVKVVVIAVRTFIDDKVMTRAAALTYSTLFAIVPILALIFAIARGFGFENIVVSLFENGLIGENFKDTLMNFINQYLQYASSGYFVGIGLLFLLFSVYSLADGIEANLNSIWHVKKARGMGRKITDYFSLLLLIPIGIICLCGVSALTSKILSQMQGFQLLGGFAKFLIKDAMPYLIAGLILTGFYMFMPNTKVKFKYAIIPGIIAGLLFQALQNLYFNGQFELSSYNAIYGGFAALPLFLLWLNISWAIILFGCELAYVSQNNDNFNYFKEPEKISRRHEDFYSLMVMSLICKRFNKGLPALKMKEIVNKLQIPHRYVISSLDTLTDAGLLETVMQGDEREPAYVPSTDTQSLTVVNILSAINSYGYCDLDHALDSEIRDDLLRIDNERKHLSGDIWNTPVAEL